MATATITAAVAMTMAMPTATTTATARKNLRLDAAVNQRSTTPAAVGGARARCEHLHGHSQDNGTGFVGKKGREGTNNSV